MAESIRKKISKYNREYPGAWGIIYQADVRTRNELAPELKAKSQYKSMQDCIDGQGHRSDFDPQRPWDYVFQRIVEKEIPWWLDLVDKPGMMVISDSAKPARYIEGDALTRGGKRQRVADYSDDSPPPLRRRRTGGGTGAASSYSLPQQQHQYEARGGGGGAQGDHPRADKQTGMYVTSKSGLGGVPWISGRLLLPFERRPMRT